MSKEKEADPGAGIGETAAKVTLGDEPRWDPEWHEFQRWKRNQINMPFGTDPRLSNQYYGMTTGPMNKKQALTAGTVGAFSAGIDRYIKSLEAGSIGAKYAEKELAQARADMKAATPKVSEEAKHAIRTERLAPVKAEIAESKADMGALIASKGGTVRDIAEARELGIQQLADAGIESEYIIAEKELQEWQKGEAKKQAAEARADNMVAITDKKQMEQLKYTADLVGDVTKVAITTMAHSAAADDRPAVDQLADKGVPWADIEELHAAALKAQFKPGTRGYHHYMLSHYKGSKGKKGKPSEKNADTAITSQPLPVPPKPATTPAIDAYAAQQYDSQSHIGGRPGGGGIKGDAGTGIGNLLRTVTTGSTPAAKPAEPAPHEVLKMQEMNLLPDSVGATNALEQFLALPKEKQDEIMEIIRSGRSKE